MAVSDWMPFFVLREEEESLGWIKNMLWSEHWPIAFKLPIPWKHAIFSAIHFIVTMFRLVDQTTEKNCGIQSQPSVLLVWGLLFNGLDFDRLWSNQSLEPVWYVVISHVPSLWLADTNAHHRCLPVCYCRLCHCCLCLPSDLIPKSQFQLYAVSLGR